MVKERIRSNNFFLTDNFLSTKTSPPASNFTITGSQTYVDIYERTDRLTAENAQVNMVAPHRSIKNQHEVRSILAKAATNILIKHIYLTPHDSYMYPLPSRDCVAIRHPGQVRRRRARSGMTGSKRFMKILTLKGGIVQRIEVADYSTGPARCQ